MFQHINLLALPMEIQHIIFTEVVAIQPESRVPLMLTCKHINELLTWRNIERAQTRAAKEHPFAAQLFSPRPYEDQLESWLPRLSTTEDHIDFILCKTRESLAEVLPSAFSGPMKINGLVSKLKLGLYLIETIRSPSLDPAQLCVALTNLPPVGLLLIRLTSIVITILLARDKVSEDLWTTRSQLGELERPGLFRNIKSDFPSFGHAVETVLLAVGCGPLACALIPMLHDFGSIRAMRLTARLNATTKKKRRCAVNMLVYVVQGNGVCGMHTDPAKRVDRIISTGIEGSFGHEVGVMWGNFDVVAETLETLVFKLQGKEDLEVLKEMKNMMKL